MAFDKIIDHCKPFARWKLKREEKTFSFKDTINTRNIKEIN